MALEFIKLLINRRGKTTARDNLGFELTLALMDRPPCRREKRPPAAHLTRQQALI
jgi:hypothetical protein